MIMIMAENGEDCKRVVGNAGAIGGWLSGQLDESS
jgi:hypothetical protein